MLIHTIRTFKHARGTWTETRGPWAIYTRARAICPDGRPRIVKLATCADTFFSVPARLSILNQTISGFISNESEDGLSTTSEQWVVFTPTGKNAHLFTVLCKKQLGLTPATPTLIAADRAAEIGNRDMEKYLRSVAKREDKDPKP